MKKVTISLALVASLMMTSCLGSFSAFNGLKDWNSEVTGSKFVNNVIFWALNIVPVYGLFLFGDAVIFNVIEFWSGSNPIAMNPGDIETKTIKRDGNLIQMTATQNRLAIEVIEGPKKGDKLDMIYLPEEQSWNAVTANGEVIKLASFEDGAYYVYMPNGEKIELDKNTNKNEGLAIISGKIAKYQSENESVALGY